MVTNPKAHLCRVQAEKKVLLASATLSVTAWAFQRMKSTEEKKNTAERARGKEALIQFGVYLFQSLLEHEVEQGDYLNRSVCSYSL